MMFECCDDFESFISDRIAELRTQKNISARDMSLSLGYGESYINHIENKDNMPSIQGLFYICEFFKIDLKDFFDTGSKSPVLIEELIKESKKLDKETLERLIELIKTINNKK